MSGWIARGAVIGLAALAGGCAATGSMGGGSGAASGAFVTRFHLGQAIARGEISVEAADPSQGGLEFSRYAAAVERQLQGLGWTIVRGNNRSEQVAVVRVQSGTREQLRRSGLSVGIGAGGGSYGRGGGVGVGGGVTVPVGGSRNQLAMTELSVRLQRRSDGTAIWEGRAQSEARAGTPAADPATVADRLASALFQGFPGESGRTIRVR